MISLALYLPLVISLDTYTFDRKSFQCRIGGSYLQVKSLPLLFLGTLWSCHGEIGKWKCERTVTLMGRWPKTNVYHIEQGIYQVDHLKRNCILYNITHGVNSCLSIQLWQGVTCPAQRRKGFCGLRVFCTKRKRAEFKSQN